MRSSTFVLVAAYALASASSARANPEVAQRLLRDVRPFSTDGGMPVRRDEQACGYCHVEGIRDLGSVRTPFGMAMLARGLSPESMVSVDVAVRALEAQGVDSDLDGIPDIGEIANGHDPNVPEGLVNTPVQFGCGVLGPGDAGTGGVVLMAMIAIGWRRSRRRVGPA